MKTSRLTLCGVFTAMALVIHFLESLIPPIAPIPGIKIGIANIITLSAIYIIGVKETFWILLIRIILGNIFAGQIMSLIYSLCGGMLCFLVMVSLRKFFDTKTVWALGIVGAMAHNTGQVLCAFLLFGSYSFLYYGVLLCAFSFVSGTFTGLCAGLMIKYYERYKKIL